MTSRTEVLFLVDNSLDTIGGAEESTKIILNGLSKNFRFSLIQPGKIQGKINNVSIFELSEKTRLKHLIKNPFSFLKYIWKVREIIKQEKPRIIHTQAQVSFFIVALLKKLRLVPNNFTLIHTERGLYTKYSNFIRKIFFFFMKELDILVTTTNFNMRYWEQAIKEKGIHLDYKVIENTAGELFETYNPKYEREEDGKIVLGFAGRYADWKNWPLAIEISEKLKEKLGTKLIVKMAVGCLDEESLQETERMFKYMSKLLGKNFEGQINAELEEMDKLYYELDVFILTSNYNTESFGRTLVEAMSRKTAVFTTDAGGSVEVVGKKDFVKSTAKEFATEIMLLKDDPEKMLVVKRDNLNRVKRVYSLENNIKKHLDLYTVFT